jgi:hypothetical protein
MPEFAALKRCIVLKYLPSYKILPCSSHSKQKKDAFSRPKEGLQAAPQERVVQSDFEGSVWPKNQTQKDGWQTSWFLPAL